ncbi:MAG: dihydropteroate synthase [Saprospiraceae bacterium]|nr:dihydropteroate synthase [Bacteroidia bacterium]MBT8229631.1 dihydropteroate synthase [Bacteroidia bacterium]NNF22408.1 dihydropteroate synthase [Saprospiraceae bacterium]NNK89608.1 dihydropteroate synthase [Saprospiraceae bacterium]
MQDLNIGGRLLTMNEPVVMGILNVTSDSFYDGGKYNTIELALKHCERMLSEGAEIIDVGGFSSSPRSKLITAEEELERIEPVVRAIFNTFPETFLSIDTYSSKVVEVLSQYGSFIVNDISGFEYDEQLVPTIAEKGFPYVLMHMKGKPENMLEHAKYDDVCFEVLDYLAQKLYDLRQAGIRQIIVDPGFGFAKTRSQNFEMLRKLEVFSIFELPVMVGLSRKSMIYKTLNIEPLAALNGTTALHMVALLNGARILRVHDIAEAVQTIKLYKAFNNSVNE